MINLCDSSILNYKHQYHEIMLSKILPKYSSLDRQITNDFDGTIMINFIGSEEQEFKCFFYDLLCERIDTLLSKYPHLQYYMFTGEFLEISKSEIRKKLTGVGSREIKLRTQIRENYIKRIIEEGGEKSKWIHEMNNKRIEDGKRFTSEKSFDTFVDDVGSALKKLNDFIGIIFNYSHMTEEVRKAVLFNFGIEVCPYCNRNYISKYTKDSEVKVTADLDHFYYQEYYKLYSLSLYNFVPSCQICNSRLKGTKVKGLLNPYTSHIDYNNFKFEVHINEETKLETIFGSNSDELEIKLIHDETYKKHVEIFQLENLYNTHKNIASEILMKKQAYNSSYSELTKSFFEEVNFDESQKNLFLYGVELDENKFHERPLAKFIYDLVTE